MTSTTHQVKITAMKPAQIALFKIERELAYSAARSDIECECVPVDRVAGETWWDTSRFRPESEAFDEGSLVVLIDRAVKYLSWLGLLECAWDAPHIVRILDLL